MKKKNLKANFKMFDLSKDIKLCEEHKWYLPKYEPLDGIKDTIPVYSRKCARCKKIEYANSLSSNWIMRR